MKLRGALPYVVLLFCRTSWPVRLDFQRPTRLEVGDEETNGGEGRWIQSQGVTRQGLPLVQSLRKQHLYRTSAAAAASHDTLANPLSTSTVLLWLTHTHSMDNLGHLADQLPRNGTGTHLATAEAELQSAFRTSALAITQLLKAAQNKSKKGEWWMGGRQRLPRARTPTEHPNHVIKELTVPLSTLSSPSSHLQICWIRPVPVSGRFVASSGPLSSLPSRLLDSAARRLGVPPARSRHSPRDS